MQYWYLFYKLATLLNLFIKVYSAHGVCVCLCLNTHSGGQWPQSSSYLSSQQQQQRMHHKCVCVCVFVIFHAREISAVSYIGWSLSDFWNLSLCVQFLNVCGEHIEILTEDKSTSKHRLFIFFHLFPGTLAFILFWHMSEDKSLFNVLNSFRTALLYKCAESGAHRYSCLTFWVLKHIKGTGILFLNERGIEQKNQNCQGK